MTLDEALKLITDEGARKTISKIITDQNKYISELEEIKKKVGTSQVTDDITMKYLQKNMRRDVIQEATKKIKSSVSEEVFNAIQEDYLKFLDANMTKERTTVDYCTDAFSLVYGQCLMNKDHKIHNVGKGSNNPQSATPQSQVSQPVANNVQQILASQAPTITPQDQIGTAPIIDTTPKVQSTRDAFKRFKDRMGNLGANKFQ